MASLTEKKEKKNGEERGMLKETTERWLGYSMG